MISFPASNVTLSLRDNVIPVDGSGRILVTDIKSNGNNNKDALICRSGMSISSDGDWYLHPTAISTDVANKIVSPPPFRGWVRSRAKDSEGHQLVMLRRVSDTAEEGVFTCHIPGDNSSPISVGIYYPCESCWEI